MPENLRKNESGSVSEKESPIVVIKREIPSLAGIPLHKHKRGQLYFVQKGVIAIITSQGRYIAAPNQGVWVPMGQEHEVIAKTDTQLIHFYLAPEQCENTPEQCVTLQGYAFFSAIALEASTISNDYTWKGSDGRLLRLIRDRICQADWLDTYLPYPQDERLKLIVERLQKHPAIKSDLIAWGKFVSASSRTLTRRFKIETGMTYSDWRQRLNVQIAIKHIVLGDSINEIAKMLGYESSSAFIYMFKKQVGVTPNNYLNIC
ncbi:AraC family transcriptional regulator [Thalassotalea profundi]|uniref:AraC family transcriptional regulator n=1 Tax=Thalassotalea profundi TaxID=2036687 RepID=A0ABQ3J150_9GAMM|nr:helix-turn-helix transcriptional regulator [Thalassotalea profundi]GHE97637.1 AraC family transcriptional regulator [Thalassotalea profundi]